MQGGGETLQRLAGDGQPLVVPLAGSERGGAFVARLPLRSLEPSATDAAVAGGARAASGSARPRKQTGWGPRLLTVRTGHPHSTIWKVLRRHGLSRPTRAPREPARRYEWPCPGDLLHIDWTQLRALRPARPRRHR